MRRDFRSLIVPRPSHRRSGRIPSLGMECLEDRQLLSGIDFPDFQDSSGLSLLGSAAVTGNARLRLTPAAGGQQGAAWYTAEKSVVGAGFQTTFQFQLTETFDAPGGSDGFVFLIQNFAPTYLAGGGGTLGYDSLPNSIAVEFDTFQNSEVNDPSPSHISVHTNGTGPNGWSESLSLGSFSTGSALLDDTAIHTVKIAYSPGTLSVYLDDMNAPRLTVAVDLAEKLALDAGTAWLGFTATTGGGWQNHDILNWTYAVTPSLATTAWVSDASVVEENGGTSSLAFTVNRAGDTSGTTTLNWATENRTATAGSDYTAASGQIVFGPGETQQTVLIAVSGDTVVEPSETLALRLSGVVGATVVDGLALGTILNDDTTVSIADASALEGSKLLQDFGRFVSDSSGGLITPRSSIFGPDANQDGMADLYVVSAGTNSVLLYDGVTGAFLRSFVAPASGGLSSPGDLAFGPDGALYVSSVNSGQVLRYDGVTGAFLDVVASGMTKPLGITFGPDGTLFIAAQGTNEILRVSGGNLVPFVTAASGGLTQPRCAVFGPDGNLYVASMGTGQVLRYNGQTGAFLNVFAVTGSTVGPAWLAFGPDGLLTATVRANTVDSRTNLVRFNGTTGTLVDTLALERDGWSFTFGPDGSVYNSSNGQGHFINRIGPSSMAAFVVQLGQAVANPVTVTYTTTAGSAAAGSDFTPISGSITFAPGETSRSILVATLNDAVGEPSESFSVVLTSATGAAISDGTGVGTIRDDDATKFFVVNDASSGDRNYQYGALGAAGASTALNSGNTAPRGAASTAAGDRIWVVDAAKKVFVYNASGTLLGSWSLGSLASQAVVEGITTNGTDVWVVDAKQDRVYRYAGAASRLSGSQNAASNFALNGSNAAPKDLVTDGSSIWVVNDSTTDMVFKYTLTGSLLGSWTIAGAGSSPTGITLDPTNVGTLWTVDSGTDRIYQFDRAAGVTSGTLTPATSFALAAGNTNPQGIADPPVARAGAAPRGVLFGTAHPTSVANPAAARGRWARVDPVMPPVVVMQPDTRNDLLSHGRFNARRARWVRRG